MVKDQEALKNKQTSWPIVYKANAILKIMVKKKKKETKQASLESLWVLFIGHSKLKCPQIKDS